MVLSYERELKAVYMAVNNVLKDKDNEILDFKIPGYEKLKYTLSNAEKETGRTVLYDNKTYKEYVRLYKINMNATGNTGLDHGLNNFIITDVSAVEINLGSGSTFPLPALRPNYPANEMGFYVTNSQIMIEVPTNAPDRQGQIALVTLYYIKLNEPIN